MRHDPIDPGRSPGTERPTIVSTEERRRRFGRRLDALEQRSLAIIAASEKELGTLSGREAGGPDDDAARMHAMTVLIDVEAHERKELEEIAPSRARLLQGTFGICEACGRTIPLSRLEAVPTARCCLVCQAKAERREATVPPDAR